MGKWNTSKPEHEQEPTVNSFKHMAVSEVHVIADAKHAREHGTVFFMNITIPHHVGTTREHAYAKRNLL